MLKIIICGINGKVGKLIYETAVKQGKQIVCGIDKIRVSQADCPIYNDFDQIKDLADVLVDFSSPSALENVLQYSKSNSLPLVLGVTGYTSKQEEQILNHSKTLPVFKSANMSIGVNMLLKLCKLACISLPDYDVEIIEKHHKRKKDSPSGTANLIAKTISSVVKSDKNIGIHSIRGGNVIGEHTTLFLGENETLSITHTANSSQLFADGALKACDFIVNKARGLFSIDDLAISP